jgi:hypothetical protein
MLQLVWPNDEKGVSSPSYINHANKHGDLTTTSLIQKCKLEWVVVRVLSIIRHLANEANTPLIVQVQDTLWHNVVRVVQQLRKEMMNGQEQEKNQPVMLYGNHHHAGRGGCQVFVLPLLVLSYSHGLLPQR